MINTKNVIPGARDKRPVGAQGQVHRRADAGRHHAAQQAAEQGALPARVAARRQEGEEAVQRREEARAERVSW